MLVFVGTFVHSTWTEPLVFLEDTALGIQDDKIVFISCALKIDQLKNEFKFSDTDIITLPESDFIIPGLIDTHIHAPQFVNAGKALNLPLLDWLDQYTYPTEAKFGDLDFAQEAYQSVVTRVLKNGTTTACYFATIHLEATKLLCEAIKELGQRALVGKVCCNQNSKDYYTETTEDSVSDTKQFIEEVKLLKCPLVQPVVTPRFAITCDSELLGALGQIASSQDVHIQSHISENRSEVEFCKTLFPECKDYTDVYSKHGLLNSKTVMAHGVYLSDSELDVFKKTGAAVSHCPNSNISLRSGLCDVRRMLDRGIKVGLGTDISGGFHPSILNAIRMATQTSNILSLQHENYERVDYKEAFRLATLGGSRALDMEQTIGNFEVGKQFDALWISPRADDSPIDLFETDNLQDTFQKFIYLGDDRNISEVYVAGRKVSERRKDKSRQSVPNGV